MVLSILQGNSISSEGNCEPSRSALGRPSWQAMQQCSSSTCSSPTYEERGKKRPNWGGTLTLIPPLARSTGTVASPAQSTTRTRDPPGGATARRTGGAAWGSASSWGRRGSFSTEGLGGVSGVERRKSSGLSDLRSPGNSRRFSSGSYFSDRKLSSASNASSNGGGGLLDNSTSSSSWRPGSVTQLSDLNTSKRASISQLSDLNGGKRPSLTSTLLDTRRSSAVNGIDARRGSFDHRRSSLSPSLSPGAVRKQSAAPDDRRMSGGLLGERRPSNGFHRTNGNASPRNSPRREIAGSPRVTPKRETNSNGVVLRRPSADSAADPHARVMNSAGYQRDSLDLDALGGMNRLSLYENSIQEEEPDKPSTRSPTSPFPKASSPTRDTYTSSARRQSPVRSRPSSSTFSPPVKYTDTLTSSFLSPGRNPSRTSPSREFSNAKTRPSPPRANAGDRAAKKSSMGSILSSARRPSSSSPEEERTEPGPLDLLFLRRRSKSKSMSPPAWRLWPQHPQGETAIVFVMRLLICCIVLTKS